MEALNLLCTFSTEGLCKSVAWRKTRLNSLRKSCFSVDRYPSRDHGYQDIKNSLAGFIT